MDIAKCEKFISFIISEIDNIFRTKKIDDNNLIHLTTELNNLKEHVSNSDLPINIKSSIQKIDTKYSIKKVERNSKMIFAFFLTFGSWYVIYNWRQQKQRKIYLVELRHQSNEILYQLRTN